MSPTTPRHRIGLIFAAVIFVLGLTAAPAPGWETQPTDKGEKQEGRDHGGKKDRDHGDKQREEEKGEKEEEGEDKQGQPQQPTVTTPVQPAQPAQPAPVAPLAAPSQPAAPGAPSQPPAPPEAREAPARGPILAQEAPPEQGAAIAPVSERRKLARTGLDPALIALLGAFSLAGGIFLFRRALAR
jgi:hypothetical protein